MYCTVLPGPCRSNGSTLATSSKHTAGYAAVTGLTLGKAPAPIKKLLKYLASYFAGAEYSSPMKPSASAAVA